MLPSWTEPNIWTNSAAKVCWTSACVCCVTIVIHLSTSILRTLCSPLKLVCDSPAHLGSRHYPSHFPFTDDMSQLRSLFMGIPRVYCLIFMDVYGCIHLLNVTKRCWCFWWKQLCNNSNTVIMSSNSFQCCQINLIRLMNAPIGKIKKKIKLRISGMPTHILRNWLIK